MRTSRSRMLSARLPLPTLMPTTLQIATQTQQTRQAAMGTAMQMCH